MCNKGPTVIVTLESRSYSDSLRAGDNAALCSLVTLIAINQREYKSTIHALFNNHFVVMVILERIISKRGQDWVFSLILQPLQDLVERLITYSSLQTNKRSLTLLPIAVGVCQPHPNHTTPLYNF